MGCGYDWRARRALFSSIIIILEAFALLPAMRTALSLLLLTSAASALTTAQGTDVAHKFTDAMTETLASGSMAKMSEELFSDEGAGTLHIPLCRRALQSSQEPQ